MSEPRHQKATGQGGKCTRYGKSPFHDHKKCPACEAVCRKCGQKGHFQSVCRSANIQGVSSSNLNEDNFLGVVTSDVKTDKPWTVTLQLNGIPVKFHIDTGAEVTAVSETIHENVGSPTLTQSEQILKGPSNQPLPVKGKFLGKFQYGKVTSELNCHVVANLSRSLLGCPAIEHLTLLARVHTIEGTQSMVEKFPRLFNVLRKLPGQYTIKLLEWALPHSLNVPHRVPVPLKGAVKDELKRMEQLGVIARVHEPTE